MSNVGGSAGEGGFDFQARLIALISVYILAENAFITLGRELEGIPTAVAAETNGPGDDIQIEFHHNAAPIEIQAKKGLRVDIRFNETIDKIASGLALNSSLNVILAVDPKTSKRIQESLSYDLKRFRQGREDTPQDLRLLNLVLDIFKKYATSDEHARELLKRLFIVTFDIETDTANETQRALTLLRTHVLSEEKQASAAWDILINEGHQIIKERGRRISIDLVRLLQSRNIQLSKSLPPVLKDEYQKWLIAHTATFSIPGPGLSKPLPIETAWMDLRVLPQQPDQAPQNLEAQLATYRGWEELGDRADAYDAIDVAKVEHRVVFIGGPGMGKSTLCRKLAYDLTILEEHVLLVHLPEVVHRVGRGMSIDEALVDLATDGFPISKHSRGILFKQVDCLIADGLDECGSYLIQIAEDLQQWASARLNTRIVITTRPIGYDSRFFANWDHQALLPLSKDQIERYSYQLIAAIISDLSNLEQEFKRFQTHLQQNRVVSLASRNPLLLGFLVQLSLASTQPAKNRAGLYEQIIDLWYLALPGDRSTTATDLDSWSALRSFEIIGWSLLQALSQEDVSGKKLTQQVAIHFSQELGIRQPAAHILAEKCLRFWQERGVLELLQFVHENMYTFVHTAIGEYAAARYLASLDIPSIQNWVREKCKDPSWREPILLAAGIGAVNTIIETLLDLDLTSTTTTEFLLTVAALAETRSYSYSLASKVIERIKTRLTSPISTVTYETAKTASGFSAQAPELIYPSLDPLLQHSQEWTRIGAMYLILLGGDDFVNFDALEKFLDEILDSRKASQDTETTSAEIDDSASLTNIRERILFFSDDWDIQNKVIVLGAGALARVRPYEATKTRLQRLYLSSEISIETHSRLAEVLTELGCQEFVEQHNQGLSSKAFLKWLRNSQLADRRMLETILHITKYAFIPPEKPRKLLALTTLVYALNIPKSGATDWDILRRLDDISAITAVLLGFVQAFSISLKELALDTIWALNELQKAEQDETIHISLLGLLPKIPVKLATPMGINIDVPTEDLVRALKHPSAIIAKGALYLLLLSKRKEELLSLLKNEDEQTLQIVEKFAN